MKIKEALFKLNNFCNANRIEYMITGTTALAMPGVPSNPQDIKVFHLKEEQEVKINAIIDKTESYDEIISKGVVLDIIDIIEESHAKHHLINVQLVALALKDKMKLGRCKDKEYMLNLIANLVSL